MSDFLSPHPDFIDMNSGDGSNDPFVGREKEFGVGHLKGMKSLEAIRSSAAPAAALGALIDLRQILKNLEGK